MALRFCFVFVCQQGELELKSPLLAASLRHLLRCEFELVAAMPGPEAVWGRPSADTLALLGELGVRLAPIENPIGADYPIANKIACLNVATDADKLVFLDSDMLCLREFGHEPRFEQPFNVKSADLATFTSDLEQWRRCYAAMHLPLPSERVMTTVSGEMIPPYFNAGMIAVDPNLGLGKAWIEAARAIDADEGVTNKRPWLDQIALPVAAASLGFAADCLDERYNYPAHLKPLNRAEPPYFCHYHSPDVLRREPMANAAVIDLARRHPGLGEMIRRQPDWRTLLEPYANVTRRPFTGRQPFRQAAAAPELLITGIPRSGTSYLCAQLNKTADCVVINEPPEIFPPLVQQPVPWGVALYHRELRRRILDGEAVSNKLRNGEFIEDTAVTEGVESYRPRVGRPDFLLATKNTLAYLARLPQLRRAMPDAAMVACVRHPLDAIASWKSTFPHLRDAAVQSLPLGHTEDPFLTESQRLQLRQIVATENPAVRRALLWCYLAEIILDNRDRLLLIRYEEMVGDPVATLKSILEHVAGVPKLHLREPLRPSSPRLKQDMLDDADRRAISGLCTQMAAEFGYR